MTLLTRKWNQVALSDNVEVLCGRKCVSWSDISVFAGHIARQDLTQHFTALTGAARTPTELGLDRISRIDEMKEYTTTKLSPEYQSGLLSSLVEGRGSKATNLRDKVFAVMGVKPTTRKADYTKSISEVYTEAAKTVNSQELISLLCCVDHPDQVPGLPSWVPDWSTPRHTTSLGHQGRRHGVYTASGDPRVLPEFLFDGRALTIPGILIDPIAFVGQSASRSALEDLLNPASQTSQFVVESLGLALKHCHPYPTSSTLFSAFCHTLVAGKDHSGVMKAPFDDYAPIFALLIDTATSNSPTFPDQPSFKRKLTSENLKVRQPSRVYRKMQIAFKAAVEGRRFAVTRKGYLGFVPRTTRVGDEVCVFLGGYIPFVVRRREGRDEFELVGECYVHDIMGGEVMQMDLPRRNIVLV